MTSQVTIVQTPKDKGLAIALALIFGPIGMLYSTILGAAIMFVIGMPLAFLTLGISLIITQPVCALWAWHSVNKKNKTLLAGTAEV